MKRMDEPKDFASRRQKVERADPINLRKDFFDVRFFLVATPSILGGGYFARAQARRLRPRRQPEQSSDDDDAFGRPIPR